MTGRPECLGHRKIIVSSTTGHCSASASSSFFASASRVSFSSCAMPCLFLWSFIKEKLKIGTRERKRGGQSKSSFQFRTLNWGGTISTKYESGHPTLFVSGLVSQLNNSVFANSFLFLFTMEQVSYPIARDPERETVG